MDGTARLVPSGNTRNRVAYWRGRDSVFFRGRRRRCDSSHSVDRAAARHHGGEFRCDAVCAPNHASRRSSGASNRWLGLFCAASGSRCASHDHGASASEMKGWLTMAPQTRRTCRRSVVRALAGAIGALVLATGTSNAQELEPRAFSPSPIGTTFVLGGFGRSEGGILFEPALDIDNVQGDLWIATVGAGHTFGLAGRQARALAVFP